MTQKLRVITGEAEILRGNDMEYRIVDVYDKEIPEDVDPDVIYFGAFEGEKCISYVAFKRSEDDPREVLYLGGSAKGTEEQNLLSEAEEALRDMGIRYIRVTIVGTVDELAPEFYRYKYDGYTPLSLNEKIYDEEKEAYVQYWIKSLDIDD